MKKIFTSIDRLNLSFWSRVVQSTNVDLKSLCIFRIIAGLFLLIFCFPTYGWLKVAPQAFFNPPPFSIAALFNGFPDYHIFIGIDFILLCCLTFIILGIKARAATILYCLLSVFALSFQFSFGKIDHSFLVIVLLACLAFSGWGSELAIIPDKSVDQRTIAKCMSLLAVLICFAFFSAGFGKLFKWINLNPNKNGTGAWYYPGFYTQKKQYMLAPYFMFMPSWAFKVMDFIAVSFELSAIIFLVYSRKAWRAYLIIAAFFHLTNLLMLNIPFIVNAIVYLAFVDFSNLLNGFSKLKFNKLSIAVFSSILLSVISFRIFDNILRFSPSTVLFFPVEQNYNFLMIGISIWITTGSILIINFLKKSSSLDL